MQHRYAFFGAVVILLAACSGAVPHTENEDSTTGKEDRETESFATAQDIEGGGDDALIFSEQEENATETDASLSEETTDVFLGETILQEEVETHAESKIFEAGLDAGATANEDIVNEDESTEVSSGVSDFEFLINTWTTEDQRSPFVASLRDGGFVVAWQSGCDFVCEAQDGSEWGVYGQRFDALGNKVGREFAISTYTSGSQMAPVISALVDGGFVVVFESLGQDGSGYGVYGQRFERDGNRAGTEFRVNTVTTYDQNYPWVAPLADGGFIVVWQSFGQDGSHFGVFGQRFASDGARIGPEFQANTYTTQFQGLPCVAPTSDGGFVVVWQGTGADGELPGSGIAGQVFDKNGQKVGGEFVVNSWTTGSQLHPRIDWFPDGGGVVVWMGQGEGNLDGIYGQMFDKNWNKKGVEFRADETKKWDPGVGAVACMSDGRFVVVWANYGSEESEWDIFGQRFDGNGERIGLEIQINQQTSGFQRYPIVDSLGDDKYVVVWESKGADGSGYGVVGRILTM